MPPLAEHARTSLEALHALMLELFDGAEFRRWLGLGPHAAVVVELPGEPAPLVEVVEKALGALKRRESIDAAFFADLKRQRPGQRRAIEVVEARWFAPPTSRLPAADAQPASDVVASVGSPSDDPFYTAGTMPAGHRTYVRRTCDQELGATLDTASFIAVEGASGLGKSSLTRRLTGTLGASRRFCRVDVDILRFDHPSTFMTEFFELISEALARPVTRWTGLVDEAGPPLVVVLDEFGFLIPELVRSMIPALYGLARNHPGRVQVVACFPIGVVRSLVTFLRASGLTTDKYCECWRPVRVPPFGPAEVEQLVAHLPAGAAAVARAGLDTLVHLSAG